MPIDQPAFSVDELKRYSRQMYLPQIGYGGQQAIRNAHVAIIGLGGLGSPSSLYLAASGIGRLSLVDFDVVELSNLGRQIAHTSDRIGSNKALSAEKTIKRINPNVQLVTIETALSYHELVTLCRKVDAVLDCSDNFETRYLVNKACKEQCTPLISAAISGFSGQLINFDFRKQGIACYECLYPDRGESVENCQQAGVLSATAGVVGCMQATESIKLISSINPSEPKLILINTLDWQVRSLTLKKDPNCPVCHSCRHSCCDSCYHS